MVLISLFQFNDYYLNQIVTLQIIYSSLLWKLKKGQKLSDAVLAHL